MQRRRRSPRFGDPKMRGERESTSYDFAVKLEDANERERTKEERPKEFLMRFIFRALRKCPFNVWWNYGTATVDFDFFKGKYIFFILQSAR